MVQEGKFKIPSEEKQRKSSCLHLSFFKNEGSSIMRFPILPRDKKSRSRHNMKYWSHVPYLGLGPAAHSFHDTIRWWNLRSVEQYCTALDKKIINPWKEEERLSPEQLELERLFLGLRNLDGVNINDAFDEPPCENALKKLITSKLVEVHSGKIIPTAKGYLIADRFPLMISR